MARVGYSASYERDEITQGGHEAVLLASFGAAALASVDVFYETNPENERQPADLLAAQPQLEAAIRAGLKFIYFDRCVTGAETVLPGAAGLAARRDFADDTNVNIAVGAPPEFTHGGTLELSDEMFDGGNSSSHGYVDMANLPEGAIALLTTSDPNEVVAFFYPLGAGFVFYSTIPLDHYSQASNSAITPAEVTALVSAAIAGFDAGEVVYGTEGADTLTGTADNDRISGLGGADLIAGLAGDDVLWGGAGDDTLLGDTGNDTLRGGAGDDLLEGQDDDDVLLGEGGNDTLRGGLGDDLLQGGDGDDVLSGRGGADTLDGGAGADTMLGGGGDDTYIVDNIGDVIIGGGGKGFDRVLASVDFRLGSSVSVEQVVLTGNQRLTAIGNDFDNHLIGNDNRNVLDGGIGADTLQGEKGDDVYYLRDADDVLIETRLEGRDTVKAWFSLKLGAHLEVLHLQSATGAIVGIGNRGSNTLVGNEADNILNGRDRVDWLKGQGGADTFVFDRAFGVEHADIVVDFESGVDALMIKQALTGLGSGVLAEANFHLGAVAQDAQHRFVYDITTGWLYFDADGAGGGAAQEVAQLANLAALQASDIMIS